MAQVENLVQTESGPRFAQTGVYKGRTIEVATGYDPNEDRFKVHVYVTAPGMDRQKVGNFHVDGGLHQAFTAGLNFAAGWIDHP